MNIAGGAVKKRTFTIFATVIALIAGLASYKGLGQLEDPEFTIKTAVVSTTYPGASAEEVELEVTDRIEIALQEMPQVKEIESFSRPGWSQVKVDIIASYGSDELPQIWDEIRKKVRDVRTSLPPGADTPVVIDDFGDVYGFLLAVVADGFTYAQLERYVDSVKKELSLVDGVARVELWGTQIECINISVSQTRISQLGISMDDVRRTLSAQNTVVDSGSVDIVDQRLRIETSGEFSDPEEIADLIVRGRKLGDTEESQRLIRIRDIGDVERGYVAPPPAIMRFNGEPAIGLSISNVSGGNVVKLGEAIDRRIAELEEILPVGIEFHRISWQGDLVARSIASFMISLAQAVAIVLFVLWIAMGFRTAFIVGASGLVFTIVISLVFMAMLSIDLQRMSLGALIIAMGMMVDNAIVVADGVLVRMQQGMDRVKAAVEAASLPAWPLLAATFIAVLAFYPIAASEESAGEYCATLFSVVAIALLVSWVLSVTVAPVMCILMLPAPKRTGAADAYGGRFYRIFKGLLRQAMRMRWIVLVVMLAMLIAAGVGFRYVDQMFFPASDRAQIMLDYWAPEGTSIQQVAADVTALERHLMESEHVDAVSTFIGAGPPRFYLPVDPESPNQSYAQLIINTPDFAALEELSVELRPLLNAPQALLVLRKYGLGPSETWPVQARFSGPAIADPEVLRSIAQEATDIMEESPHAAVVRTNWRQRVKKLVAEYDETNARWTSVSRGDIADATRRAYDGLQVGLYREEDKLLPILMRYDERDRDRLASMIEALPIQPPFLNVTIPLSQVTTSIDVEWDNPVIWRWDRRRAITVQGVPKGFASALRADVIGGIEAIDLPPGYELMWDGEFRSSQEAQQSLIPGMVPAGIVMALIIVGLFNALRPPLIIVCVVPFAVIGITVGLLATGQPFGFVALLGAMSLVGMMIKNAIVLLDQIDIEKAAGRSDYDAVMEAALSRLRPVMLAAGTTVLGVIPLLPDVFWVSLAVTIMFGLAFGSLLTMFLIPVLYAIFFKVRVE